MSSPKKAGGNIFDRLTDTSKYTGAHKERFNADGTGKGKAGRADTTVITGHTNNSIAGAPKSTTGAPKVTKPKTTGIFDRLTDSSKYTGAHKERFNADGTGKGKAGREDTTVFTGHTNNRIVAPAKK